jgi:hypothetical protein
MSCRSTTKELGCKLDLDIGLLAKPFVKRFQCGSVRNLKREVVQADDSLAIKGRD